MSHVNVDSSRPLSLQDRALVTGARVLRRHLEEKDPTYKRIDIKPLGTVIGAEIHGVDLRQPLDEELKAEIHQALLEWKVIFFRKQQITSEQHLQFANLWGELEQHHFIPQGDTIEIARLARDEKSTGYENVWHADVTWRLNPSLGAVLRMIEKPPIGGDTLWADMAAAYDNLPQHVKDRIDGLTAIHDFTHVFGRRLSPEVLAAKQREFPAAEHPIVRTHPETGRKTLFVNAAFTTRIVGLSDTESEELLQYLFSQAHIPEYQVRFHWEKDSIAFWDNRATQHYAVSDYYPNRRVVERISIVGDRPY